MREWVTRYDVTSLNYIVQTLKKLKTCKVCHKRAAAGKEENRFRDAPTFVGRGGLETNNTGGPGGYDSFFLRIGEMSLALAT